MNNSIGSPRELPGHALRRTLRGSCQLSRIGSLGWLTAALCALPVYAGEPVQPPQIGAQLSQPAAKARSEQPRSTATPILHCKGEIDQRQALDIGLGQSTTFSIDDAIRTRSVGNPGVVQSIQTGPSQLYLVGTRIGSTNMVIQGRNGACSAVSVTVSADTTGLQEALAKLMPEETDVHVRSASDALVLSGQVSDAMQAQRIVELAQRFAMAANPPVSNTAPTDGKADAPQNESKKAKERVINMLTVAAPQQVMLEVKVAEVSKKLVDELKLNAAFASSHISAAVGTLLTFGQGRDGFAVNANKSDQPVKILAEPNLMAISGQKASFLAGGKVFIPVPQSMGVGMAMITLQEETYGVKLSFMPTVLRNGVINLQVSPEVSDLADKPLSGDYGKSSFQPIPIFDIRSASTTIQLKDGQSFAIGGLLKDNVRGQLDAFPGLGEIPILGALFRSTKYQAEKTELVFIVTPHLVKPLPTSYPLPTDTFGKVNRWNMLATGNMERTPTTSEQSGQPGSGDGAKSRGATQGGAASAGQEAAPIEQPAAPIEQPAVPIEQPAVPIEQPAVPIEQPAPSQPDEMLEEDAPVSEPPIPQPDEQGVSSDPQPIGPISEPATQQ